MKQRIDNFRNGIFAATGCEAALISAPADVFYLANLESSNCALLLLKDRQLLFTDSRYTLIAKCATSDFEIIERNTGIPAAVKETLKQLSVKRTAIQENSLTLREYMDYSEGCDVTFVPSGDIAMVIRSVKTEAELNSMRKAQAITDSTFSEMLTFIKEGVTEKEIASEIEYRMRRAGAEKTSFDTICASGENGAKPHATPSDRKITKGDLITMDFGCVVDGYGSDMTRTVAFGKPCDELIKIYNIVLEAHNLSKAALRSGISGKTVDAVARDYIKSAGYGDYFGHGLGHGVGVEIHELPLLSFRSDRILQSGNIVTIEPGIYVPGLGGVRIENMCLVTENGFEDLTKSEKSLIIL